MCSGPARVRGVLFDQLSVTTPVRWLADSHFAGDGAERIVECPSFGERMESRVSKKLAPDERREIIDWIVSTRTGLHGDQRDPVLGLVAPYTGGALAMNAKVVRAQLEAMADRELLSQGAKELEEQTEMNARFQVGQAWLAQVEQTQEAERKRADRQEFARRGGSVPKKMPGVVAACEALRSRGITSAKQALTELRVRAFETENGRFTVCVNKDDRVEQVDKFNNRKTNISRDSFRTGYWSKL
jgi:hypothetical protein